MSESSENERSPCPDSNETELQLRVLIFRLVDVLHHPSPIPSPYRVAATRLAAVAQPYQAARQHACFWHAGVQPVMAPHAACLSWAEILVVSTRMMTEMLR